MTLSISDFGFWISDMGFTAEALRRISDFGFRTSDREFTTEALRTLRRIRDFGFTAEAPRFGLGGVALGCRI
jgi:hypothetical protein